MSLILDIEFHLILYYYFENNMSSLKHANFVEKSIMELLDKHCITQVTHPFIVNPLTVSVSGSG